MLLVGTGTTGQAGLYALLVWAASLLACADFVLARCRGYFTANDDYFVDMCRRELLFCRAQLCLLHPHKAAAAPARRRQQCGASSSHAYACKHESSHLMPALKIELLNYISASSAQQIASGSVQAIRIRAAREPQDSWSKARCIPCARSRDIKMLVPQHALGCRMDARERAPSTRHGAVTAALLRARSPHGCARRRRKTVPSRSLATRPLAARLRA